MCSALIKHNHEYHFDFQAEAENKVNTKIEQRMHTDRMQGRMKPLCPDASKVSTRVAEPHMLENSSPERADQIRRSVRTKLILNL